MPPRSEFLWEPGADRPVRPPAAGMLVHRLRHFMLAVGAAIVTAASLSAQGPDTRTFASRGTEQAESPADSAVAARPERFALQQLPEPLQELVRDLLLEHLPDPYEDDRRWGQTKRVWSGIDWGLDGIRIQTKRRWKDVNHGEWRYIRLSQVDPEQNLMLEIHDVQEIAPGRFTLRVRLASRLDCFARFARWRLGVQTYSVGLHADAAVVIDLDAEICVRPDFASIPPGVAVEPRVRAVRVQLTEFQMHRIGKLTGPLADELGRVLKRELIERVEQDQEKLVAKMNRQLAKRPERLRISLQGWWRERWRAWTAAEGKELGAEPSASPEAKVPAANANAAAPASTPP